MQAKKIIYLFVILLISACGGVSDEDKIKSSLIGESLCGKEIQSLSEVDDIRIQNKTVADNVTEFSVVITENHLEEIESNTESVSGGRASGGRLNRYTHYSISKKILATLTYKIENGVWELLNTTEHCEDSKTKVNINQFKKVKS